MIDVPDVCLLPGGAGPTRPPPVPHGCLCSDLHALPQSPMAVCADDVAGHVDSDDGPLIKYYVQSIW